MKKSKVTEIQTHNGSTMSQSYHTFQQYVILIMFDYPSMTTIKLQRDET